MNTLVVVDPTYPEKSSTKTFRRTIEIPQRARIFKTNWDSFSLSRSNFFRFLTVLAKILRSNRLALLWEILDATLIGRKIERRSMTA